MESILINLNVLTNPTGSLISIENFKDIPFEIKRVFYLFGLNGKEIRGKHAHKRSQQIAICLNGSCNFLLKDGIEEKIILLNSPSKGLLLPPNIWREMYDFSSDCVLMVLANDFYDENEYIRDYNEFLKVCNINTVKIRYNK